MIVQIGLLFSLTGTTSITEKGQYQIAKFALEGFEKECDSQVEFKFITKDIKSDPNVAVYQIKKLIATGIRIFAGCYSSACRKAILPLLKQHDCLLMYPALYEGKEIDKNVLYTGEVPNQQIETMLDYITRHFGKNIFLIGSDYIYPHYTNQQVHYLLGNKNGSVVGEHHLPLGHTNFSSIIDELKITAPDVVLSTVVGESQIPFYRALYEAGFSAEKIPVFSPITKESEIEAIGATYMAGHYACGGYFQSIDSEDNIRFVKEFNKFIGCDTVISSVMLNTYIGVRLLLESITETQSTYYQTLLDYLSGKTYETPEGTISIDNHHHLSRKIRIGRVCLNGQFTIVWDSKDTIKASPFFLEETNGLHKQPTKVDWQAMILEWGKISDEPVLLISNIGQIVYANQKACDILEITAGQVISNNRLNELRHTFTIIREFIELFFELIVLRKKIYNERHVQGAKVIFSPIVTKNAAFQKQLKIAEVATRSNANVLILGETGVGKEVLACAIHEQSLRAQKPFIAVNTAALPENLIASELFGYVDGAFTGARKGGKIGKFEMAQGGTLFLDEIGDMPIEQQAALLRTIEQRKITRIGDTKERAIDVRIIAATNKNLKEEIAFNGSFRSDLYFRLNVLSIHIPALRDRREDILELVQKFLAQFQKEYQDGPNRISNKALEILLSYPWPGNVREIRNILERSFLLAIPEDMIQPYHLPDDLFVKNNSHTSLTELSLNESTKQSIITAVNQTATLTEASKILGISRSTLYRKLKEFDIKIKSS
ncbi:transporter substrate-binding protein [Bacillus canaveralius]|uniref:transporter substrate-binding protein n=1 Tax=Bacillus canaveralius TaxID=1403243 RepID=UPI000F7AB092|nr:transporter substrate-binding protein [Bacillus canaveralius]RSK44036.1 AAA family ATPase [Bacillus canaveralius]